MLTVSRVGGLVLVVPLTTGAEVVVDVVVGPVTKQGDTVKHSHSATLPELHMYTYKYSQNYNQLYLLSLVLENKEFTGSF